MPPWVGSGITGLTNYNRSMRKWLSGTRYAIAGLALFFPERNARIRLAAAILVLIAGIWLQLSIVEICLVLLL
ncbi:MAG: diacylglycerol kinase [Saprospiraceae bacterium]|nr:diacylglycerol kinase [Candidatus Opimibacter iunctus]